MGKKIEMAGKRFGRLVVLSQEGQTKDYKCLWLCRCDCGNVGVFLGKYLRNGDTRSCGCLKIDSLVSRVKTHGLTNHPLYEIYMGMLRRCKDPSREGYKNYGGRGVKVLFDCVEDFYDFAMNNGWEPGLHIDRIDNNGPYSRDNCRFVTQAENNRNRRNIISITHPETGETFCAAEWSRKLNGSKVLVYNRIYNHGWTTEEAITTPKGAKRRSAPTS